MIMVDQRLVAYIRAEEAQGFTPAQLKTFLVSKGYTAMQADEAINYAAHNNLHPNVKPEHAQPLSESIHVVPAGATVVATLLIILGFFMSSVGTSLIIAKQQLLTMMNMFSGGVAEGASSFVSFIDLSLFLKVGVLLLIVGLIHFGIAWGLLFAKKWGWYAAIVMVSLYSVIAIALVVIASIFVGFIPSFLLGILPSLLFTTLCLLLLLPEKTKAGYF